MRTHPLINRGVTVSVIALLVALAFTPSIHADMEKNAAISTTFGAFGTLSGYVNDTNKDPIDGALVRVHFHGTYEEDYTDSSGYYHVTNIPICWCMKNCTASKEGYITEWVLLSIGGNETYDFVLERDDSGLAEFTTEVCGLPGQEPQTVQLTQEQADEVDRLFEDIRTQLDMVETREEAVEIFNEAIVELDRYGLLGGMSVKQAQRLITGGYDSTLIDKIAGEIENVFIGETKLNLMCLIFGNTTRTLFAGPFVWGFNSLFFKSLTFFDTLSRILQLPGLWQYILYLPLIPFLLVSYAMLFKSTFVPLSAVNKITFGYASFIMQEPYIAYYPAFGSVWTVGLLGVKEWDDRIYGRINDIFPLWYPPFEAYYPGAICFTGIKIVPLDNPLESVSSYMGFALAVRLGNERPYDWIWP